MSTAKKGRTPHFSIIKGLSNLRIKIEFDQELMDIQDDNINFFYSSLQDEDTTKLLKEIENYNQSGAVNPILQEVAQLIKDSLSFFQNLNGGLMKPTNKTYIFTEKKLFQLKEKIKEYSNSTNHL